MNIFLSTAAPGAAVGGGGVLLWEGRGGGGIGLGIGFLSLCCLRLSRAPVAGAVALPVAPDRFGAAGHRGFRLRCLPAILRRGAARLRLRSRRASPKRDSRSAPGARRVWGVARGDRQRAG